MVNIDLDVFGKSLDKLKTEYSRVVDENNLLKKNMEHLKSEHWKDDTITSMDESIKKLKRQCSNYGLYDTDYNKLMSWWNKHLQDCHKRECEMDKNCECKILMKPSYHIQIDEFAECTCYSIVCNKCKKHESVYY